jgi:hypothetical protein
LLVFVSSLFYGLGKNEWTLAFLAAIVVSIAFILVRKNVVPQVFYSTIPVLLIALAGLLFGNLFSYMFDSFNYLGGFNVMWRISKASLNLLEIISTRWQMVLVNVILFVLALVGLFSALKKQDVVYLLFFVWGAALLIGFLVTSWAVDPRYYAPSFLVLVSILPLTYEKINIQRVTSFVWAASAIMILASIINFSGKFSLENFSWAQNSQLPNIPPVIQDTKNCIIMAGVGEAFITGEDFVSNALALDDASALIGKYDKAICQP